MKAVRNVGAAFATMVIAALLYLAAVHQSDAQQGGGFPPATPPYIVSICTTACSGATLQAGQAIAIYKANLTSRTSLTVPAIDPDLQVTGLAAGTYRVTLHISWEPVTLATQGLSWYIKGATTIGAVTGSCVIAPNTGTGVVQSWGEGTVAVTLTGTANTNNYLDCWALLTQTSSGTIGFYWAQDVTNADATDVIGGTAPSETQSSMEIFRVF